MQKPFYFINGKFLPKDNAKINVKDLGILRGYGIFDFLKTYNHIPFMIDEHINRLYKSAKLISLEIPWNKDQIKKWIYMTLEKNNYSESQIRIVITGGATDDTMDSLGDPTIIILVEKAVVYPKEIYEKGVGLKTFPIKRIWAEAKTINYIPAVIIHKKAVKQGYYDGIYLDEKNNILEVANANIFFFIKNDLITPKNDILYGVTRKIIIDLAKNIFKVKKRQINLNDLQKMTECFFTVSSKEVVPVTKINNIKIGNGLPGKNTKLIIKLFKEFAENYKRL